MRTIIIISINIVYFMPKALVKRLTVLVKGTVPTSNVVKKDRPNALQVLALRGISMALLCFSEWRYNFIF